jgi:hypothetical protein
LSGHHPLDLVIGEEGEHRHAAGSHAERPPVADAQGERLDRKGAFAPLDAYGLVARTEREIDRVLCALAEAGQRTAGEAGEAEPVAGGHRPGDQLEAEEEAAAGLVLIHETMRDQPAQHAVDGRLAQRGDVDDIRQPHPLRRVGRQNGQHHGGPADILIQALFRGIRVRHLLFHVPCPPFMSRGTPDAPLRQAAEPA